MESYPIYRGVSTGARFVQRMLVFTSQVLLTPQKNANNKVVDGTSIYMMTNWKVCIQTDYFKMLYESKQQIVQNGLRVWADFLSYSLRFEEWIKLEFKYDSEFVKFLVQKINEKHQMIINIH